MLAIAVTLPSVTALIWLVRLEGRVNANEAAQDRLARDVTYIRNRIDSAIGVAGHIHRRQEDGDDDRS